LDNNVTSSLDTNASLEAFNDKGLLTLNAHVDNKAMHLKLYDSQYDIRTGEFNLSSHLKSKLTFRPLDISADGHYKRDRLVVDSADLHTTHAVLKLNDLHYSFSDQNLSASYKLSLKPYPNAPYHGTADIYGSVITKPALYATLKSHTLDGELDAYISDKHLSIKAKDLSIPKLIAFSGQHLPITQGRLNATVSVSSPSLLEGNVSTMTGYSDIKVNDMLLEGVAIDDSLKTLRESQDLNLFQGSFSELPVVRSIKNIPSDLRGKDISSTHFREMRFLTDINNSIIHCKDCALATDENLIAIQGDINLSSQTFNEFYVGLLFPTNCAYFIQQVEGNLSEPQVQLAAAGFHVITGASKSIIGNLGSALDLGADIVKGTGSVVGGAVSYVPVVGESTDKALTRVTDAPKDITAKTTECTPFYNGTVKHPKQVHQSRFQKEIEKIEKKKSERR
ncbi:MAG: hypothetical protein WBF77_08510, partial [Sulfurimonadaceae bacterium]